jgi:hypothetical protein
MCADDLYSRASISIRVRELMLIRRSFIALSLLLTTAVFADDVPLRKEVFHNDRVTAYSLEIPPQQASTSRPEKDTITVLLTGTRAGETQFKHAGALQSWRNDEGAPLQALVLELNEPQGEAISEALPVKRQCAEGSRIACVEEKHLFCTKVLCANDVRMGPGATRSGFGSDAAQMLIAVSDYTLNDAIGGAESAKHSRPSGQVEWIPAGAENRWTNSGKAPAHFIIVRFSANH